MIRLRSSVKSLKNRLPSVGSDGSTYRKVVLRQNQPYLTINFSTTSYIARCQHEPITSTVINADATKLDNGPTPINNTSTFSKTIKQLDVNGAWEEYRRVVQDPQVTLKKSDYYAVSKMLKNDTMTFTSIKRLQALLRDLHQREAMPDVFVHCCDILMSLHLQHEDLDSALLVFDGMMNSNYKPSHYTVRTILEGVIQYGSIGDALSLNKALHKKKLFPQDMRTYEKFLKVLGLNFGDLKSCDVLFNELLKKYNNNKDGDLKPTTNLYNLMFNIYYKNQPKSKNTDVWSLYEQLMANDSGVRPNWKTYEILIKIFGNDDSLGFEYTARLYQDMQRLGIDMKASHYNGMGYDASKTLTMLLLKENRANKINTRDLNLLINSAVKDNKFDDAWDIYQFMVTQKGKTLLPNVITYATIMKALVKDTTRPTSMVFDMYEDMKRHNIQADHFIINCLLQACRPNGDMDKVIDIIHEMRQSKISVDKYLFSNLISAVSNKESALNQQDMDLLKSVWDEGVALDTQFASSSCNKYLRLWVRYSSSEQQQQQQEPTQHDNDNEDSIHLAGPPMSDTLKHMMTVYHTMRHMDNKMEPPDWFTYSLLIKAMVDEKQSRQALVVFRDAQTNKIRLGANIYNLIMQGLLLENNPNPVMHLWQDMKVRRIWPNRATYDLVLDACEQLGLVESFKIILQQRQSDADRLDTLDRMHDRQEGGEDDVEK
ncbi:hypothetical protein BC941DRAFT_435528 [Chlamydoabsidia padenii]|nr:hypothetical protein BC941DRAFT_435528 [Chlamydoabsidia padenii]